MPSAAESDEFGIEVRLDELLASRDMTLAELARQVGITVVNLSILKNGRARAIRYSTLAALCEVLQCQPGDLLRYGTNDGDAPAAPALRTRRGARNICSVTWHGSVDGEQEEVQLDGRRGGARFVLLAGSQRRRRAHVDVGPDRLMAYIDPSNADAAQGWDGPVGDFWTDNADLFDASVSRYLQPFLAAAAIGPAAQVLDVGCGIGQTTREAARLAGAGGATGVDLSARMLDLARRRAEQEGLTNVRFEQADAQVADLGVDRYDRVSSRAGVMFFGDPVAAFANLARALKPDGRLVLLVWQSFAENEWLDAFLSAVAAGRDIPPPPPDGPGPFSLDDADRVRAVLTAAGFGEPELVGVREPMFYGRDVATAEAMVLGILGGMLVDLDDTTRADTMAALRATLAAHLGADGVTYRSAMWIVTAERAG